MLTMGSDKFCSEIEEIMTSSAEFDELLQQLKVISSKIERELSILSEKKRTREKEENDRLCCSCSGFSSNTVTAAQKPRYLPEVRSTSAETLSPFADCNSALEVQRSFSIKGDRVREKQNHSCCWFLPSSKGQTNRSVQQGSLIKAPAAQCGKISGKQFCLLSKSYSAENPKGYYQNLPKLPNPSTNHSSSYDGSSCTSSVLESSHKNSRRNWTNTDVDKIFNTQSSANFSGKQTQAESNMKSSSSSKTRLHLDITKAQGLLPPNVAKPLRSPRSVPEATMRACLFDPTKYQLRPSTEVSPERRNVPHMGSQRLNSGSSPSAFHLSNGALLPAEDHIYSNEPPPLNYQGISYGHSREALQANSKVLASRAHSFNNGAGVLMPKTSLTVTEFKSSLASVTRQLSLETEGRQEPVKAQTVNQCRNTEKLIAWIMNSDEEVPCDVSVLAPKPFGGQRATSKCESSFQNSLELSSSYEMQRFQMPDTNTAKMISNGETDGGVMKMAMKDHLIHDNGISISQRWHQLHPVAFAAENQLDSNYEVDDVIGNCDDMLDSPDSDPGHSSSRRKRPNIGANARPASQLLAASKHPEFASAKSISDRASEEDSVFRENVSASQKRSSSSSREISWNKSTSGVATRNNSSTSASVLMNIADCRGREVNDLQLSSLNVDLDQLTSKNSNQALYHSQLAVNRNNKLPKNSLSFEQISDISMQTNGQCSSQFLCDRNQSKSASQFDYTLYGHNDRSIKTNNHSTKSTQYHHASVKLSQSIASLQNLFSSCNEFLSNDIESQKDFDRLYLGSQSALKESVLTSGSSSETLHNLDDCDDITEDELSSSDNTDKQSSNCLLSVPQAYIPAERNQSDEAFDQNNNKCYTDESDDGWESEFFGTLSSESLDWCYEWDWDSPTNTLQRKVIQRHDYRRNKSVIPIANIRAEKQNRVNPSAKAQDSNPDVIPPESSDVRKNRQHAFPGAMICHYIVNLASEDGFFGSMIKNFVQCTMTGIATDPCTVIRNIRQFIDGLKNYLMQQRETKLNGFIKEECSKIKSGEFLNMETITERALHKCVLRPLYGHIQKLFADDFTRNGNLRLFSDGMKSCQRNRVFRPNHGCSFPLCLPKSVEAAWHYLQKMAQTYSPLKKLKNLISAVSAIRGNVKATDNATRWSEGNSVSGGTDALLMNLVYILVEQGMISAEIEANYMWGLIHPSCLTGESIYYLTLFSSAVALVKNLSQPSGSMTSNNSLSQCLSANGLVKIHVPDEKHDHIWTQMLPYRPNSTTSEMRQMMAYKLNITNPQEYGLCLIKDSEEIRLDDAIYLNEIKKNSSNDFLLAYKRINAKFIWPKRN